MRYSLSNYILSITCNDSTMNEAFGTISIGGEGSYLNTVSISHDNQLFTTVGYPTGGWVHDKNLSRTGKVNVTLNQLTEQISKFKQLCKFYLSGDYDGLTITLSDMDGKEVASCVDCYPQQIPQQDFAEKADNQTWVFTSGKITFN